MNRTLRTAVVAALLLAAGNSWALGLGQIQVKSKRNQPLVAEIPIISTTPGELASLQARLASPETFRRVGLSPPSGIAADLQFSLGSDGKGRPVIRVTTLKPVEQGALDFLIEVDWGAGRLVREYSALVDVPNTAGADVPVTVQMPQAPDTNLVQRPVLAAPVPPQPSVAATTPMPVPAPQPAPVPAAESASEPAVSAMVPLPPLPSSAPVTAAPQAAASLQYGPVKQGETLSQIAGKLGLRNGFSLDQALLALLRANPDAFLGDDVNRLRGGAVLHVPARDDVAQVDAREAEQVVRQQMRQWQQGRRALRQPEAASPAPVKPATDTAAMPASKPAEPVAKPAAQKPASVKATPQQPARPPASAKPEPVPAATVAAKRSEARLQIVPPTAPGKATGTKSGTAAGGEGSMLQQQLRQRDEDIAAKSAEIGELKERVAALERLKDEQQKLIAMKDSELAAAQSRLADANTSSAQAVAQAAVKPAVKPAAKPAAQTTAQPAPEMPQHSGLPYVWGGLGFAALALLAWRLAVRRKPAAAPARRSVFDSEALAASMTMPSAAVGQAESSENAGDEAPEDTVEDAQPDVQVGTDEGAASVGLRGTETSLTVDLASVPPVPPRMDVPQWHSGWVKAEPAAPDVAEQAADASAPAAPAAPTASVSAPVQDAPAEPAPVDAPVVTQSDAPAHATPAQRFKLVRAFLDMGDEYSAQQLLLELLDDQDDSVSDEAARMLSKLVG